MSENTAPGEKPVFVGIREQRVSTLLMSILTGLSVFLSKILSLIPMAVLYGVFLFMGVSTLNGLQVIILLRINNNKMLLKKPYSSFKIVF